MSEFPSLMGSSSLEIKVSVVSKVGKVNNETVRIKLCIAMKCIAICIVKRYRCVEMRYIE